MARRRPVAHLLDIYAAQIRFATDRQQWKLLRREIDSLVLEPDSLGHTTHVVYETTSGACIPFLVFFVDVAAHASSTSALVQTISHEATHGAGMLLDQLGQPYDGTSEALAYLVGWLTCWMWENCDG